jgi:DNA adenine methylase
VSAVQQPSPTKLDPLFPWPGGKRWLVPKLIELVPERHGTYYEPFFGAGALFFALRPAVALVSDQNRELMDCYRAIKTEHEQVARHLRAFPRDSEGYYRIRASSPTDAAERAARLIYLTTLAFNGIYRLNRRGEFNVPYGRREYPNLGLEQSMTEHAAALRCAAIQSVDFEMAVAPAGRGDVVYLDPPYTVAHSNNGFVRYNEHIFSWRDQQRLAAVAVDLDRRGCIVIMSNANHESISSLYQGFRAITVSRRSLVAADPAHRRNTDEVVFTNA